MTYYRQCTLTKGETSEIVWIPEQFATQGKYVRIGDVDGWNVRDVSKQRVAGDYLQARERDYLNHRKATDI
jgi:hypothetical protein